MVKNPPAVGFNPWVGKIPWRRAWHPTSVFWPGESPWTEEPGELQSMGLQRVGREWMAKHSKALPHILNILNMFNLKKIFYSYFPPPPVISIMPPMQIKYLDTFHDVGSSLEINLDYIDRCKWQVLKDSSIVKDRIFIHWFKKYSLKNICSTSGIFLGDYGQDKYGPWLMKFIFWWETGRNILYILGKKKIFLWNGKFWLHEEMRFRGRQKLRQDDTEDFPF